MWRIGGTEMSRAPALLLPKLPRTFQTVLLGLGLGLAASLVSGWGFWIVFGFLIDPFVLPHPYQNQFPLINHTRDFLGILTTVVAFLFFGSMVALFTCVPSTIGGGVIGIVLDRLASFRSLDTHDTDIVGALVGFGAGWYSATFLFAPEPTEWIYYPTGDPLWMGVLGALVGIAHSRILARWLKKRMEDQSEDAGSMGWYGRMAAGFIVGGITVGLVLTTQSGGGWIYNSLRNPLWAAGVAVLGGVVVSWRLDGWLKRRMR